MPSITYWNRLEPRARAADLAEALAARVRDPAWFLARQWQLGEFRGEDAGSPAYVRIEADHGGLRGSTGDGPTPTRVNPRAPLERYLTAEPGATDDLARAVELGQVFERCLREVAAFVEAPPALRDHFLAAYPIGAASGPEAPRAARLRALWRGRAIDGLALVRAARAEAMPRQIIPPTVPLTWHEGARRAVRRLCHWVDQHGGLPAERGPAGWRADALDYQVEVRATGPDAIRASYRVTPDRRGDVDWYAFDRQAKPSAQGALGTRWRRRTGAAIPGPVRFRGMPNERFWDFEDARLDLGAVPLERGSLATMLFVDFMLVHGNDWYLVPFEVPAGTVTAATVRVVDVFGGTTLVPRADAGAPTDGRFSMFAIAATDGSIADGLVTPVSAATSHLEGAPLEVVRFQRDEMANLAWAVEHTTAGALGRGERADDRPPTGPAATTSHGAVAYRLRSEVPAHWFPLAPVKAGPGTDQIVLERAALVARADEVPATPRGRILAGGAGPFRLDESRVPREGTTVTRAARRARGADGTTYTWVARTRRVGAGEAASGLAFDLAVEPAAR